MKKILFVFPSIASGGAERNAIIISNYLSRNYKYDISFIILDDSVHYKKLFDESIKIKQLNINLKKINRITRVFYTYIYFGVLIYRHSKKYNYDYILSIHEFEPEFAFIPLFFLYRIRKIPSPQFISIIQTVLSQRINFEHRVRKKILFFILNYFRKKIFSKIVAASLAIKNDLNDKNYKNVILIPNVIDTEEINIKINNYLQPGNTNFTNSYIINVARISPQKNQIFILKAFNKIKTKTNFNLLFIGEPVDKQLFRKLNQYVEQNNLKRRIFFKGVVENPFVFMKNAMALVVTSNFEGMPLSILESMFLKVPVISTRFNGYEEIMNDETAFLVSNEEQLAETFLLVNDKPFKTTKMIERSFQNCIKYDIKNVINNFHNMLKN